MDKKEVPQRKQITLRIPGTVYEALGKEAKSRGYSVNGANRIYSLCGGRTCFSMKYSSMTNSISFAIERLWISAWLLISSKRAASILNVNRFSSMVITSDVIIARKRRQVKYDY